MEATMVDIPDNVLGEAVKVFGVPRIRGSNDLSEPMVTFCKSCLAPHHLPKQIVVLLCMT